MVVDRPFVWFVRLLMHHPLHVQGRDETEKEGGQEQLLHTTRGYAGKERGGRCCMCGRQERERVCVVLGDLIRLLYELLLSPSLD